MSALLFSVAIDWVMRQTTEDQNRGIRWNLFTNLEDLDFADDLALLSHTHHHIQEKTGRLNTCAKQIGLKISKKKTEVMILSVLNPQQVQIDETILPFTEKFTYLGSYVTPDGGAKDDIITRLGKAITAFRMLNPVWKSQQYKLSTKIRLYRSCVLSTLLYGSECWRMTDQDLSKLSSFHTKNLRKIARIFWPQRKPNEELLEHCQQESIEKILVERRWKWIGHVLRKSQNAITRVAVQWKPEGRRKRGRLKTTRRRTAEAEAANMG
ncbi:endonuclease-reverse transcriptase [Elysia marginata]|uniref:Endonuclease-reverse transcriptase n=1 Tax=Elysia marginata TaxID=1093978 RepID=A0AAV4FE36_9GAST|nr:endonuclease-reverse transcriptase [Elysia marginata]